jgi:hypothetical protein
LDLCVSLLSVIVGKFHTIKVPHGSNSSNSSKYRAAKRDINHAESTTARIYAAWTQGGLSAPKIGELFAPEHPPLRRYSLDQWIAKLNELHIESARPTSPLPQIEKLRSFSSIDAMEYKSLEDGENDSLDFYQMAAAKDDEMKQALHDQMSKDLPAVCDSLEAN